VAVAVGVAAPVAVAVDVAAPVAVAVDVAVPVAVAVDAGPVLTQLAAPLSRKVCPATGMNCQS
jgi:hypothetical protein